MIGILYFIVIIFANTLGAVSGMSGGVIIKPVLDFIGAHSVSAISFYSAVAVFTMSIVSTTRQVKNGVKFNWIIVGWISIGAVIGGMLGNIGFDWLLGIFENESGVKTVQIILTILTLLFALLYTRYQWGTLRLESLPYYLACGLLLGFLASLLGIGGGPINVSLLMLLFAMPIKEATVYSICTIFFSQFSKLLTIAVTVGFAQYDLSILWFVIPAAVVGGFLGSRMSKMLSSEKIAVVFQSVIVLVLLINFYNLFSL